MVNIRVGREVVKDVQLAVFDKDGTLIDVHTYWVNMIRFRAELVADRLRLSEEEKLGLMNNMGVDTGLWKIKPEGPVGIKKREIVLKAGVEYLENLGIPDQTLLFEEVFRQVDENSLAHFHEIIKPLNGLYELFDRLKKHSCLIAIATTDRSERARLAMRHIGLEKSIDFIAGADSVKNPKPAADMANLVATSLGVPKEFSVIVGDAVSDVQMGVNAKFGASIGVASGLTTAERLLEITPFVVSGIAELSLDF
jgi:phosphoglycolate phosphatase-like HAD superfamily hydrolase